VRGSEINTTQGAEDEWRFVDLRHASALATDGSSLCRALLRAPLVFPFVGASLLLLALSPSETAQSQQARACA